jgi:hypothetical protein
LNIVEPGDGVRFMKKLINKPEEVVKEELEGVALAHAIS